MKYRSAKTLLMSALLLGAVPALADAVLPVQIITTPDGPAYVTTTGMAVYMSDADADGKSACIGDCTKMWVPLPVAAGAAPVENFTIVERPDGIKTWVYQGHPLYTYATDVSGKMLGATVPGFHIVSPVAVAQTTTTTAPLINVGIAGVATWGTTTKGPGWVDIKGMALYNYDLDVAGKPTCNGDCAAAWPPLKAEGDVAPVQEWSVVDREDGTKQWAFRGHPLYTFVKDTAPGEVNGDGISGFHKAD